MNFKKAFLCCSLTACYFLTFSNQAKSQTISYSPRSISANGSVIAGNFSTQDEYGAFRYTEVGGIISLGALDLLSYLEVRAISADGAVIIGNSSPIDEDLGGEYDTFKYTVNGGVVSLGFLPGGDYANVIALSADGSVITGYSESSDGTRAFKYTDADGMVSLGALIGGSYSYASDISADGSVITGFGNSANGTRAFKYTDADGIFSLGTLAGGTFSQSISISADGSVIVGYSGSSDGIRAFKYTDADGMISLGVLDGGTYSGATLVSADGSVIAGTSDSTDGERAFKYTSTNITTSSQSSGNIVSLGVLDGGTYSSVTDMSADGSIIIGTSSTGSGERAFKHTDAEGIVSLGTLDGGTFSSAIAISDDGSVILGSANNSNGDIRTFIYNNSISNASLVDEQNTYATLYYNGKQLNSLINLKNSLLRSTLTQDCNKFGQKGICVAIGGRYGATNKNNASEEALNLRLAYLVSDHLKVGVILDQAFESQDPTNYSVQNSQPMVGAFVNLGQNIDQTGFNLRFSGAYHNSRINVTRNVLSGTEGGVGTTNLTTNGVLAEISYLKNFSDRFYLKPFVGFRKTEIQRDGYTENNNISFPISYNSVTQKSETAILGVRSSYKLKDNIGINLGFGVEHNLRNAMDGYVGVIPQVNSFSLRASNLRDNTAFIDAGFYYDIEKNQRFVSNVIYGSQSLNSANTAMVYAGYVVGF